MSAPKENITENPQERHAKIQSFVEEHIEIYKDPDLHDDDLWEIFRDDFKDWKLEDFKEVTGPLITKLRNQLRRRGVLVLKGQGTSIAQRLLETIQQENPLEWSKDEIEDQLVADKLPFDSRFNPNWNNQNLPPLSKLSATSLTTKQNISDKTEIISKCDPTSQQQLKTLGQYSAKTSDSFIRSNGRELADMAKSYFDEDKYSGSQDRFDFKLTIFKDICQRINLAEDKWIKGLPIMLKGNARTYYYQSLFPHIDETTSFETIINKIKSNFEGAEYHRTVLETWQDMTLDSSLLKSPEKSISENFENMLTKLRDLQLGLAPRFRDEDFLYTKLLQACKRNSVCELACFKPAPTLEGLIIDLRAPISLKSESRAVENKEPQIYYTDRRYKSRPARNYQTTYNKDNREEPKKCFICKKNNCWSSKHTDEEREQHRNKWQKKFQAKANSRYNQYLVEGLDEISEQEDSSDAEIEAFLNDSYTYTTQNQEEPMQETFFGQVDGKQLFETMTNLSTQYAMTWSSSISHFESKNTPTPPLTRYDDRKYHGIMIDTGAATISTAGLNQYLAYRRMNGHSSSEINSTTGSQTKVKFGIGSATTIGIVKVNTPLGDVEFFVISSDTPFLLSLYDMDRLKIYFNNLENVIIQGNKAFPVIRQWGHPFLLEKALSINKLSSSSTFSFDCFLTNKEIRQLHRRFGHPSANRLLAVLEKSGHDASRKFVEYITKLCTTCQKHGRSPRRFKFTLKDDSLDFNHSVYVDIMYINSNPSKSQASPVLHVVDEATGFQAGRWLANLSSQTTWNALRHCWIDTYSGPPDILVHDAGTNFTSQEFKQYADSLAIQTKCIPVEAHHSIGIVERYHLPVRRAYECLQEDLPDLNKESILQMAFKATNDVAGPGGIVPTLLVFGCYPRMSFSDLPQPTIKNRVTAIRRAMSEVSKLRARRQVVEALRQRNGPNVEPTKNLPINSEVLVWRDNNNSARWDGPFKLLNIEGDTCKIQLENGLKDFRITSVKPYLVESDELPLVETQELINQSQLPERRILKRNRRLPARYNDSVTFMNMGYPTFIIPVEPWSNQRDDARYKELNDLQAKMVFSIVEIDQIPKGTRIFGSRWVDTIKNEGTPMAFAKARLVVQGYNDFGKKEILTQSPTIQRASQRLILSIAAMHSGLNLFLRDISQAYVQAITTINRDIYVLPPSELGLDKDKILKVEKPLYGLAESGNHWYITYHNHHTKTLGMTPSTHDSCLLYRNMSHSPDSDSSAPIGLTGLQTDDTLFLANHSFAKLEKETMKFLCKEREKLTENHSLKFNGSSIQLKKGVIILSQETQCDKIEPAVNKVTNIAQRARGAYIATTCQPEAAFDLSFAAQIKDPQSADIDRLNKRLLWQKRNGSRGLKFIPLDTNTLKLVVFTDSSFATNPDYSSQLGYVIALVDGKGNANILH